MALETHRGAMPVAAGELNEEQVDLIKRTIAKGASNDELALFIAQCNRTGLDPFARQIYCVGRYDAKVKRDVFATQVSIDGARLVAERSGRYAGQTPVEWTADGATWVSVWLSAEPPRAARVGVHKAGFLEPMIAVATWNEYVQTYRRDGKTEVSPMWKRMGALMLGKCAEMLALRRAFPMELSGLYIPEEMDQATSVEAPPAPEGPKPTVRSRPAATRRASKPEPEPEVVDAEIVSEDDDGERASALAVLAELVGSQAEAERQRLAAYLRQQFGPSAQITDLRALEEATAIAAGWPATAPFDVAEEAVEPAPRVDSKSRPQLTGRQKRIFAVCKERGLHIEDVIADALGAHVALDDLDGPQQAAVNEYLDQVGTQGEAF